MKKRWTFAVIFSAVVLGMMGPITLGETGVVASSQTVSAFSLQEMSNGDYIGFATGSGNLPHQVYLPNKGFVTLFKTVYIGNATYQGFYRV